MASWGFGLELIALSIHLFVRIFWCVFWGKMRCEDLETHRDAHQFSVGNTQLRHSGPPAFPVCLCVTERRAGEIYKAMSAIRRARFSQTQWSAWPVPPCVFQMSRGSARCGVIHLPHVQTSPPLLLLLHLKSLSVTQFTWHTTPSGRDKRTTEVQSSQNFPLSTSHIWSRNSTTKE